MTDPGEVFALEMEHADVAPAVIPEAAPDAPPVVVVAVPEVNDEEAIAARAAEVTAEREARSLEDRVPPGSVLERTPTGWHVSVMYGGAPRLFGDGVTLALALRGAGV